MINPPTTRISFKIDSKDNWDFIDSFSLEESENIPDDLFPLKGELGISVGNESLEIYCGISNVEKWYNSFILYKGTKNKNNTFIYYEDKNLEQNSLLMWDETSKSFKENNIISLDLNDSGILTWDQNNEEWEINNNYVLLDNIDCGFYNTNLEAPSFVGKTIDFSSNII
jgi:hypothetical protein